MSLTTIQFTNKLAWTLSSANTGFANTTQGLDFLSTDLSGLSTTTWNQLFAEQYTLSGSGGTTTFDLSDFTNLVCETTGFAHVLTILVTCSGTNSSVTFAPAASNGLTWFLGGTSPTITLGNGESFSFSSGTSSSGAVVDSTHKQITLTNSGTGAATVKVVALGSTN